MIAYQPFIFRVHQTCFISSCCESLLLTMILNLWVIIRGYCSVFVYADINVQHNSPCVGDIGTPSFMGHIWLHKSMRLLYYDFPVVIMIMCGRPRYMSTNWWLWKKCLSLEQKLILRFLICQTRYTMGTSKHNLIVVCSRAGNRVNVCTLACWNCQNQCSNGDDITFGMYTYISVTIAV